MFQSFRILLVEDDDSLRNCLSEFLAEYGWYVGAVGHSEEAVWLARRQRFDFSILDFHLPGMTGLELFQHLATIRPLPGILMSGQASAEEAAAARHAGFFTFLRKPLELDRLRQAVQMLIHSHFGGPLTPLVTPPADPQQHLQRPQPPSNPPRRQF
ncbi:MAG: response regulator [Planctomycetes bacterium]|nr:response regulator [Planctomycetota bacterium]